MHPMFGPAFRSATVSASSSIVCDFRTLVSADPIGRTPPSWYPIPSTFFSVESIGRASVFSLHQATLYLAFCFNRLYLLQAGTSYLFSPIGVRGSTKVVFRFEGERNSLPLSAIAKSHRSLRVGSCVFLHTSLHLASICTGTVHVLYSGGRRSFSCIRA